jgi:hypothetical protein
VRATSEFQKDLRKRTKTFALRIVRMFSALPTTTEAQLLGRQLLRSGTSIGADYREAFRARSKALTDNVRRKMQKEDLRNPMMDFAVRVIRMFTHLPNATEA